MRARLTHQTSTATLAACKVSRRSCRIGGNLPERFNILLFDGFSNHCLANLVEPLRAANTLGRQPLYDWQFCSLDGASVQSSSGLAVTPHAALPGQRGDVLVVMPSYGYREHATREATRALLTAAKQHDRVAGLDTGSWLLAQAGLLEERRATIHWDELTAFAERFPGVQTVRERFVIDGNRLTCSGAMATFDLTLALIRQTHGPLLAMQVAQLFMSRDMGDGAGLPVLSRSPLINRALTLMQATVEAPLPIGEVARRLGCSQKTLEQRIRVGLNMTPQALYRHLRLDLARRLTEETDQSVAEIAGRCGYDNASAMTRAFKAAFGAPPTGLRARARST